LRHLQFSLILIQFGLYRCPATAGAPRKSRFKEVTVGLELIPQLFKSEQFFQRSEATL
jgi:hypothetical protein